MWSPLTNGATLVYLSYLKPLFRKHEVKILEMSQELNDLIIKYTGPLFEMLNPKVESSEFSKGDKKEKSDDFTDIKTAKEVTKEKEPQDQTNEPEESKKDR